MKNEKIDTSETEHGIVVSGQLVGGTTSVPLVRIDGRNYSFPSELVMVFSEASQRSELKDLVWKIYQDPAMVLKATQALKEILEAANGTHISR